MTPIRRLAGIATLLLSGVGVLLCLAGTVSVWLVKSRADTVVGAVFETADEAFDFIETRLDRVNQTLEKSRQSVSGLSTAAERLKTTGSHLETELEPLMQMIDEVYGELKAAEHWLDSCQAVASGINRVSESMAVSKAAASRDEASGVTAKRVAEFSAGVADALARLQVMRQELITVRDKRTLSREFAAGIISRVAELDTKLASISARIGRFNAQASTARASCVDLGRKVRWWIAFATVTLTLLLLWFGASQFGMMIHGRRFARRSAS